MITLKPCVYYVCFAQLAFSPFLEYGVRGLLPVSLAHTVSLPSSSLVLFLLIYHLLRPTYVLILG